MQCGSRYRGSGLLREGVWERRLCGSWGAGWRGGSIIGVMVIDMNEVQVRTLEQVRQVVVGTQALESCRGESKSGTKSRGEN